MTTPGNQDTTPPAPGSIAAIAVADPQFATLAMAIRRLNLGDTLGAATPRKTVFAPTNAAFQALLDALNLRTLDQVSDAQLQAILLYHVATTEVTGEQATASAMQNGTLQTLGGKIKLSVDGSNLRIDGRATVTKADVAASNGVVHVIDNVLLPSITDIVTTRQDLASLAAALTKVEADAGFAATLDDDAAKFTVFAPNTGAFTSLVEALSGTPAVGISSLDSFANYQLIPVLRLHVAAAEVPSSAATEAGAAVSALGGGIVAQRTTDGVTINGAKVSTADILASNGIVHVIDGVLLPSIADIVTTAPELSGLKGLVSMQPSVGTALAGAGPFTLFAPNNAAVAAVTQVPDNLADVLLYHAVTEGAPTYASTALALSAETAFDTALAGQSLRVSSAAGKVLTRDFNDMAYEVTTPNYLARNGVLHIINGVLIPAPPAPTQNIAEIVTADARFSTLLAAVVKAGLAATLSGGEYTVFAPTNEAFDALFTTLNVPSGTDGVNALTVAQLQTVLFYHVINDTVLASQAVALAQSNGTAGTLGGTLKLSLSGANVRIDDRATVTQTNILATNGVIHALDQVLLPSVLDIVASRGDLSSLETAVTAGAAALVPSLDNDASSTKYTLFAPDNDAFTALVTALGSNSGISGLGDFAAYQLLPILKYHVATSAILSGDVVAGPVATLGGTLTATTAPVALDGATVTVADLVASNGVVHVVENVLLPSITEIVINGDEFSELERLVVAAPTGNVATALDSPGSLTLFAPQNSALTGVASNTPGLGGILLYHALGDAYYAADVPTTATTLATVEGTNVTVQRTGSDVSVDEDTGSGPAAALVTAANYFAANGIIHLISRLLTP